MPRRRSRLRISGVLATVLAVACGMYWQRSSRPPLFSLQPETPYVVDVQWEQAVLDLEFSPGTRYLFIISSLGDPAQEHHVTLRSAPVDEPAPLPVAPLERSQPRAVPLRRPPCVDVPPSGVDETSGNLSRRLPRTFHLHVTDGELDDPKQYARLQARPIAEGRRVRVFLDSQQREGELFPGVVDEMVDLVDDVVTPRLERVLGRLHDVDGDGKFVVLLTPWLDRLEGGKTSLGGFVRSADFRSDVPPPFGNHCDMLYLNSNVRGGPHLETLLAHEMAHAVCFSERIADSPGDVALPDEEDWLNEAVAHLAEDLDGNNWSNLDYRISRYMNEPERYPLVVADYYGANLWRSHGCRGATYLFLRWCVDQYGEGLLRDLVVSPLRGVQNLERVTGARFDDLFRRWTVAMWRSGRRVVDGGRTHADAKSISFGDYASLDLCAPLAGWGLAGPRTTRWDVSQGEQTLQLRGTAASFVEVHSTGRAGYERIRIAGQFGGRLQMTAIRLNQNEPAVSLAAATVDESAPAPTDRRLAVWVQAEAPGDWRVETVACERNHAETREPDCFCGDKLARQEVLSTSDAGTGKIASYELPLPPLAESGAPLVVKVVVRSADGRRGTAHLTLDERLNRPLLRVAEAPGDAR